MSKPIQTLPYLPSSTKPVTYSGSGQGAFPKYLSVSLLNLGGAQISFFWGEGGGLDWFLHNLASLKYASVHMHEQEPEVEAPRKKQSKCMKTWHKASTSGELKHNSKMVYWIAIYMYSHAFIKYTIYLPIFID